MQEQAPTTEVRSYSVTFSNGETNAIAKSKRAYSAAWCAVTRHGPLSTTHMGFARDEAAARKAISSETAYLRNKRLSPDGGEVVFEEIVKVEGVLV